MAARAVIVFLAALLLIRVSGRRSFGQHSAFDICITVLLGAVLSRAVVGASPFLATLGSAAVLVAMHRLIAWCGVRSSPFERLVSGTERVLVDGGAKDEAAMRAALISERDLRQAMRKRFGDEDIGRLERAVLERDGEVSLRTRKCAPHDASASIAPEENKDVPCEPGDAMPNRMHELKFQLPAKKAPFLRDEVAGRGSDHRRSTVPRCSGGA